MRTTRVIMGQVVHIGLGTNVGQLHSNLALALRGMGQLGQVLAVSRWYHSAAWGLAGQPTFLNGVAALHTSLPLPQLLQGLQQLEHAAGRQRLQHWGPRTLDLDILLAGSTQLATAQLQVPHPLLAQRRFVLLPLADVAPLAQHPSLGRSVAQLLATCTDGCAVWC